MEALQLALVESGLPDRVILHLRARCPRKVHPLSDVELRMKVEVGLARARYYGLSAEPQLATFVGLMFVVGPSFDEHPWIRRVLRDTRKPAEVRLKDVMATTPAHVWKEAAARRGPWRAEPARVGIVS